MPPATNDLSYEEFYKEQLWAIEYFEQKAKFASESLPLAFTVGETYKTVRGVLEDTLGGMAKRSADVPGWLKNAYDKVGEAKGILDEIQADKGLDELNIEALNNAAKVYNDAAEQIRSTILKETDYYAQRDILNDEAWAGYYQGQAFAHIHALDDMLQLARQTQVNYQITTEALKNHADIYNESEGAVPAVRFQNYEIYAEYAAQDDYVTNRITLIEAELNNALDAVLKWNEKRCQIYFLKPENKSETF